MALFSRTASIEQNINYILIKEHFQFNYTPLYAKIQINCRFFYRTDIFRC